MKNKNRTITGILTVEQGRAFLLDKNGTQHFAAAAIWDGYIKHWVNTELNGRLLAEKDYVTGRPIALLWPHGNTDPVDFVEIYYNERLVKYRLSYLGHMAINVNGEIFNFSHLLNECEIMDEAEYFYRPALGIFAPGPDGFFNTDDPQHPYQDKFGRQFMRNILVARITGVKTAGISEFLHREIETILATPADTGNPLKYRGFNTFTRSCTTITRDALRSNGFTRVRGISPADLFINIVWNTLLLSGEAGPRLEVFPRPQMIVKEAPPSAKTPVLNPVNRIRQMMLRKRGIWV